MDTDNFRSDVLRAHGARADDLEELLAYTALRFEVGPAVWKHDFPLADEPSTLCWQRYAERATEQGVFSCLQERLVQLRFPITEGISKDPAYRAATRRGDPPSGDQPGEGLHLEAPGRLRLLIHQTAAGRLPVLVAEERRDFEALLRALTRRNEPAVIPPSVGAMMVAGYNNWDRISALREVWERENPAGHWADRFRELIPHKERYQDRFILLSYGPYSDTPAEALGLDPDDWLERSLTIRLEHECCHYFTRRVLGTMNNAVHDELIADYTGIVAAAGHFRAGWFLRFMGLESPESLRAGGRLESYRGDPPLSDDAFLVLQRLVRGLTANLESADQQRTSARTLENRWRAICALASLTLEEMACADGDERIAAAFVAAGVRARERTMQEVSCLS